MSRQILITGGQGDLAQALVATWNDEPQTHVLAPGRVELDVTKEEQVRDYFSRLSRLDVLVANAGMTRDKSMIHLPAEDFSDVLDVSLRGTFLCVRAALKIMLKQETGHLLLIGSRAAKFGTHGQSAYAAAKAGLVALAQSVAKEYGPRNIRCNVVLPGFLETKFTAGLKSERKEFIRAEHALQRFNTVSDSARAIAFISTLEHVSGQVFTLDSRIDAWT